jgi:NAD(P)-dependent dehydrogenase (short-subunit alcohol dehydrogenase family)
MPELEGKTALITGSGALGGIGGDTAALFAQEGAEVVITGRNLERGQQVVESIHKEGGRARFVLADLADLDDVARLADETGEVDILINNAASYNLGSSLQLTVEDFNLMYDSIVRAPYFLVQKIAAGMVERGSGSIVNVSSTAASVALPGGMSLYGSAKAALDSLTRYWAAEFVTSKVRVNSVAVGPTGTENVTAAMTALGPGVMEGLAASIPMNRWAAPREISEVILFLASDRASFATGGVFSVDGGKVAV